jgi:hypothetical protein
MSFTTEELDNYPLCGSLKKDGSTCRQHAGAGTDHKGLGRCKWHLGNSPSHRQHAVKQEALAQVTMGRPLDVSPGQAIQAVLNLSAGGLAWLTAMVNALQPHELKTPEAQSLIHLQGQEKDRVARLAKAASDMGVDERQLVLQKESTKQFGEFLDAVLDRIRLTADQRRAVGQAIRDTMAEREAEREAATKALDVDDVLDVGSTEPVPA